jgi:hypothetical protein
MTGLFIPELCPGGDFEELIVHMSASGKLRRSLGVGPYCETGHCDRGRL